MNPSCSGTQERVRRLVEPQGENERGVRREAYENETEWKHGDVWISRDGIEEFGRLLFENVSQFLSL